MYKIYENSLLTLYIQEEMQSLKFTFIEQTF